MADQVRWGVLGVAKIAVEKVIPAMQQGTLARVDAIASRKLDKAREAAVQLGLDKAYGSYEELLADPEIDAIYNPLPNHLHVPWTIRAAQAGKHVLCEKPIALSAEEARELREALRSLPVKVEEAFMVWTHPQWLKAREIAQSGEIGTLRALQCTFSYFNRDPENVRNVPAYGGGGLMDIGCYPIITSRFILGREPKRVVGLVDEDPEFKVDRLTTAILDFGEVHSSFTCSMQMVPYQRSHIFGSRGHIEIEIPFNAPPDRPCRIFLDRGDPFGADRKTIELEVVDQYTIQGEEFSRAILEDRKPPLSLSNSIRNMEVIDAIFRSAAQSRWESIPGDR